jgi:hypothetical protein
MDVTLENVAHDFPAGTTVSVYPSLMHAHGRPPMGVQSAVTSAVVAASGSLTLTGLAIDTEYVAYALVAGAHRYRRLRTPAPAGIIGVSPEVADGGAVEWDAASGLLVPSTDAGAVESSEQTANYTLALSDAGTVVEINSAGAVTVTVPPNSSVAFDIGTLIEVARMGAGTVTLAPDTGVTIRSPGSLLDVSAQYSAVSLRKRATNEWVLVGDLA